MGEKLPFNETPIPKRGVIAAKTRGTIPLASRRPIFTCFNSFFALIFRQTLADTTNNRETRENPDDRVQIAVKFANKSRKVPENELNEASTNLQRQLLLKSSLGCNKWIKISTPLTFKCLFRAVCLLKINSITFYIVFKKNSLINNWLSIGWELPPFFRHCLKFQRHFLQVFFHFFCFLFTVNIYKGEETNNNNNYYTLKLNKQSFLL